MKKLNQHLPISFMTFCPSSQTCFAILLPWVYICQWPNNAQEKLGSYTQEMSTVNITCQAETISVLKTSYIILSYQEKTFGSSLRVDKYNLEPNLDHDKIMTVAVMFMLRTQPESPNDVRYIYLDWLFYMRMATLCMIWWRGTTVTSMFQ